MPFDGTSLSQTKKDLLAARQLLIDKGWQPWAGEIGGPHCPVTALMEVQSWSNISLITLGLAPFSLRFRLAYKELVAALPEQKKNLFLKIPCYNVDLTNSEPALALFDRAIENAI